MKAVLVIDLPDDINVDDVGISYIVQQWSGLPVKAQVEHIPLKPLPKKAEIVKGVNGFQEIYNDGWNACLEEITGETE